ncbi:ATP-dependent helicase HrpB [Cohnella panacarvi]|uniref:ATP-dependent helicase HrpB n=1 Tax=Cohnella panacarvi TaxID=400776 RepID=UPI000552F048|nr:ATP-dependent helicase HrpB [Cohnella panacarvi]
MDKLPIESVLPDLRRGLEGHANAVLIAAPGAGKTTRVPLALLNEAWLAGNRIIMLEPRRLAARSAAKYMASAIGEAVGETVGYRVRMDTKVGPRTRIEVVTEGVLTRMLQDDPALDGVGLVIFDEFHERSLQADLGLALSLQSQVLFREDLKLLVMSATLEAEPVAKLLGDAPVVVSEGRAYPVETIYRPHAAGTYLEDAVASAVVDALRAHEGDVLAFLPGIGEIRAVEAKLGGMVAGMNGSGGVRIHPLHGSLPIGEQDAAIAPNRTGGRKVVLSTSVAETSLTVEGITVVIDAGLMRVSRFSPRTGMSRLETVPVSAASADQRRGRAGRLGLGTCYRLWSREEQDRLAPRGIPEIMEADLSPLLLELAVWGVRDPAELAWLDAPPLPAQQQAKELLTQLGALDAGSGAITAHGKRMSEHGVHPRVAHMLIKALPLGLGAIACELAVLLSERDIVKGRAGADIRLRLDALHGRGGTTADEGARRRLLDEAGRLKRELDVKGEGAGAADDCGLLLAFAYPDRIARRRDTGKYLLSGGRGAAFASGQALSGEEWIVVADVDDAGTDSRIRLAAPLAYSKLLEHLKEDIDEETDVYWDSESHSVRARTRRRLGAIVLEETPTNRPPAELVLAGLLKGIRAEGLGILPWTRAARQYQERVVFVRHHDPQWPDLSDDALLEGLEEWLAPYVEGMRGRSDLQRLNVKELLEAMLNWEQRRLLDTYAPTHWTVPSGSRLPIDYADIEAPVLAVRLQELFGLPETPCIAGGRVALTLHLLSPAQRPVQVTRDLASFWRSAYFEVRKDLKGRYPKHYWPDDPLEAQATRRAKPPGR